MEFRKIIVPLDGSSFAEHALSLALSVAAPAGSRLELVGVVDPNEPGADAERVRTYLEATAERVQKTTPVDPGSIVLRGKVAEDILQHAIKTAVDLVVMATHGGGPFSRAWFGSVADQLMRTMPLPLLLVRPRSGLPGLATARVPRRVVIALDGSPRAEQIVDPAVSLGALWGADYRLLRVVPPGVDLAETGRRQDEAKAYLMSVWERFLTPRKARHWNTRAVAAPDVAPWILKYANRRDDLIALTTRGLGGLDRLVVGSVADKVIRGSVGPVLVRRPTPSDGEP